MITTFIRQVYSNIGLFLTLFGFIATAYVFFNPLVTPGLEGYFLLPFTYSLCAITFKKVFIYQEDSFGLKCFFVVSFVRYVLLPIYACYTDGIGTYNNLYPAYYRYAILVQLLELILSYWVINKFYVREYERLSHKLSNDSFQYYNDLGIAGVLLAVVMVGIVFVRGHLYAIIELARFLVVTDKFDTEADYWTYDIWAIQVFFAYMTVTVTSTFMKRNVKKNSMFNLVIPLIVAFFSCTIILTNNRMTMVYYALSGLCVLMAAFPRHSKMLSTVMISVMLVVIVSFTLMKNFGVEIGTAGAGDISDDEGASALSAYVCGVDNIAHTCDMYEKNGNLYGINNFLSTIYRFCMPTRLPFFSGLLFAGVPTAVDYACQTTEMVSVAGETYFWGSGMYFGWLFDMIAVYFIVRLLVIFDIRTKLEKDLGRKYVYNWLAVLFGIYMCYCIQTLWNNTTYMPLYLSAALWVNQKFKFKKTIIE